nr:DNA-directed DNA polymerase [Tanacetum cinerariifolium]
MRTRSKSYPNNSNATIPRRSNRRRVPNIVELKIRTIKEVVPMAYRTMKELLQAPTAGYGEAIIILEILAENFEIKTNLLQLVQTNKFHGFERDNPHTHISKFKMMTSTLKYKDVPNDTIKLMLFPYSLEGAARIWYEKEPSNSILTWDDLVNKFVNQFFPPSKTTHLKNEISRFTQKFKETFREAWERFKEMLRAYPHHGFSELAQIDTFYNGLNEQDQDSLNAVAGGNLLSKTTREALKIIKNKSKVRYSRSKSNVSRVNTNSKESSSKTDDRIDKLADQILNLVEIVNKQVITPDIAYYDCIATDSNQPTVCAATGTYNQVSPPNRASNQIPPPGFAPVQNNQIRLNDQKLCEKATNQMEKFFQIFHDLHFDISFADALLLMPKFSSTIKSLLTNKDKLFELAKVPLNENCSAMLLKKLLEKLGDPDKFLIPCDFSGIDVCHALADLADRSITRPKGVAEDVFVKVGKFHFPTDFVVVDFEADPRYNSKSSNPTLVSNPSFSEETKSDFCKEPIIKSSLPTLTPFGESDFFLEEIEDFLNDESISTGIENSFYDPKGDILYLEKLLNDDPFQLPLMDLKQAEETKAKSSIEEPPELELKELPSYLEYAFLEETNKLHVSPIHCVPKKGGMTIVANENNELIPIRLVTEWRVCIDYRKLNDATRKDHFPLPFMDQMLERLAVNEFYCFLDGFSRYFQIPIDPQDQEKTTFTCPYGTFAYRRMPFGLCNTPGHKISKSGIEVDRAKFDIIAKLPHPTTVKGVKSFLGHAGFYRRFIQDFSKIARPMTHLLEKETPFMFSKECVDAFETLKKKLTEALILVVPDWNLLFKLMCDASDFAIGVVLGQCKRRHFQPIHYASKTMAEAQIHYTTTEKKMLAVVYVFEKFRPYLVLSKSIVYTDHSALKYLLSKQDAKSRLLWWIKLYAGVCMAKKLLISSKLFMKDPPGAIMEPISLQRNLPPSNEWSSKSFQSRIESILKRTVGENHASWSDKLDDALWAFRTAFKTPIGCTPYKLTAGDHRKLQLNDLNERRDQVYENSLIYKERTKKLHDSKIKNRIFNVGDQVLLFNSRLKIFSRKLKTRWSGPFTITQVFPYGTVELSQPNGPNFKVNGHRVKHYFAGDIPSKVVLDLHTIPMDK